VPGGESIRGLHDTGTDFDSIAEQELRKAAKMIEDAANRLLTSRPRQVTESDVLSEEDINSAILDAARAITVATGSLVKAAVLAQRERIAKQRDPKTKHFYRADPAWANGLISAAQAVGGTTQDLVTSANGFVRHEEGMDDALLISAARQVAAATARLMAASRAKSDPFSETHANLGNASKEVGNATKLLVEAARKAAEWVNQSQEIKITPESDLNEFNRNKAALDAAAKILRLEEQLNRARQDATNINKAGYATSGPGVKAGAPAPATTTTTTTAPSGGGRGAPSGRGALPVARGRGRGNA